MAFPRRKSRCVGIRPVVAIGVALQLFCGLRRRPLKLFDQCPAAANVRDDALAGQHSVSHRPEAVLQGGPAAVLIPTDHQAGASVATLSGRLVVMNDASPSRWMPRFI